MMHRSSSTTHHAADAPRHPLSIGAAVVAGMVVLGTVLVAVAAARLGWATGLDLERAAALAGGSWAVGAATGMGLVWAATRENFDKLGIAVLAASIVRMLVALSMGLGAFLILNPEPRTFWTTFLVTGLAALVGETAWAVRLLRSMIPPPLAHKPSLSRSR